MSLSSALRRLVAVLAVAGLFAVPLVVTGSDTVEDGPAVVTGDQPADGVLVAHVDDDVDSDSDSDSDGDSDSDSDADSDEDSDDDSPGAGAT